MWRRGETRLEPCVAQSHGGIRDTAESAPGAVQEVRLLPRLGRAVTVDQAIAGQIPAPAVRHRCQQAAPSGHIVQLDSFPVPRSSSLPPPDHGPLVTTAPEAVYGPPWPGWRRRCVAAQAVPESRRHRGSPRHRWCQAADSGWTRVPICQGPKLGRSVLWSQAFRREARRGPRRARSSENERASASHPWQGGLPVPRNPMAEALQRWSDDASRTATPARLEVRAEAERPQAPSRPPGSPWR